MKKPVLLAILDGFGLSDVEYGNAVAQANTPNYDRLCEKYAFSTLHADGEHVGLPEGQMGNSEVGHLNIGAGRVVYQSLVLINKAVKEKTILENEVYVNAMNNAKDKNLHIMGLLSDGGVHAHINHMIGMLNMAKEMGVENVFVHAFLDGRDVDPKSAETYLNQINEAMAEIGVGKLATVSGRYYSMDRDKRWDRVELAYDAIVSAKSENTFTDAVEYVKASYEKEIYDEFIMPAVNSEVAQEIKDGDSVIMMNFRPDRAMQLAGVLTNPEYNPKPEDPVFVPSYRPEVTFVQTMKYSNDVKGDIAFVPQKLDNTFGQVVSEAGLNQLRIAETEKYPHVTFFFDGGEEVNLPGMEKVLINSPKVATYDLKPEMSAYEVTEALLTELDKDVHDTIILNFANPDMVGHSGDLEATIKAVEVVDECLGKVIDKVVELDGAALITADHGNSDKVLNEDGSPNTAHTTAIVPCVLVKENVELRDGGALSDIAPTLLQLLNIEQPAEMTGKTLLK